MKIACFMDVCVCVCVCVQFFVASDGGSDMLFCANDS